MSTKAPLIVGRLMSIIAIIHAFSSTNTAQNTPSNQRSLSLPLSNKNNDFDGFNPFQPGSKVSSKSNGILTIGNAPSTTTPGGRISPRAIKMKEITSALLNSISDEDTVRDILMQHQDFLVEQFDNLDCVLEEDSIFTPDMNREERFNTYEVVMEERIESARIPAARNTLMALKEFVLSKK